MRLRSTLGGGHTPLKLTISEQSSVRQKYKDLVSAQSSGGRQGAMCYVCTMYRTTSNPVAKVVIPEAITFPVVTNCKIPCYEIIC